MKKTLFSYFPHYVANGQSKFLSELQYNVVILSPSWKAFIIALRAHFLKLFENNSSSLKTNCCKSIFLLFFPSFRIVNESATQVKFLLSCLNYYEMQPITTRTFDELKTQVDCIFMQLVLFLKTSHMYYSEIPQESVP